MKEIKVYFLDLKFWNPISWLIKKVDKAPFTHVAINIGSQVYESNAFGCRVVPHREIADTHFIIRVLRLNVSIESFEEIKRSLDKHLGKRYGYLTILGIFFARVFKRKNFFSDKNDTFICSEYVAMALEKHFNLSNFDKEVDGPRKLYEILRGYKI